MWRATRSSTIFSFSMNNYPALGTFIVTLSLAHRLAMLASSRLIVPTSRSREMLSFNRRFCGMMRRLTAPHSLHVIDTYRLMDILKVRAIELMVADHTKVVLNTCADMTAYTGARGLAINRLYNSFGDCIGYGPRPGFPSIDTQLDQLERGTYLADESSLLRTASSREARLNTF